MLEDLPILIDVPPSLDLGFDELLTSSSDLANTAPTTPTLLPVPAPPTELTYTPAPPPPHTSAPPPPPSVPTTALLPPPTKKQRPFLQPLSDKQLEEKSQKYIPPHTARQNRWAVSLFKSWLSSRNSVEHIFPRDILEVKHPIVTLEKCLCAFIFEGTVTKEGRPLVPVSVNARMASLYRYMQQQQGPRCPNICDRKTNHSQSLILPSIDISGSSGRRA